jgi:hypothetical protein
MTKTSKENLIILGERPFWHIPDPALATPHWPPAEPEVFMITTPPGKDEPSNEVGNWMKWSKDQKVIENELFRARHLIWCETAEFKENAIASRGKASFSTLSDPLATTCFDRIRLPSELIPTHASLKKDGPKSIKHCTYIRAFDGRASYLLMSKEWRDAIEDVEPGVHQFFPYQFRCESGRIIDGYYLFHNFAVMSALDGAASGFTRMIAIDGVTPYWTAPPTRITRGIAPVMYRDQVSGHHYWYDKTVGLYCVSRALGRLVYKLLPKNVVLWPISLTPRVGTR